MHLKALEFSLSGIYICPLLINSAEQNNTRLPTSTLHTNGSFRSILDGRSGYFTAVFTLFDSGEGGAGAPGGMVKDAVVTLLN